MHKTMKTVLAVLLISSLSATMFAKVSSLMTNNNRQRQESSQSSSQRRQESSQASSQDRDRRSEREQARQDERRDARERERQEDRRSEREQARQDERRDARERDNGRMEESRHSSAAPARTSERIAAQKILKRTAAIILKADRAVKQKKVYTGQLARAISHQKLAKQFYQRGDYRKAVQHSMFARKLATQALRKNAGRDRDLREMETPLAEEREYTNYDDNTLRIELKRELPNETEDDSSYSRIIINLDVED